MALLGQYSDDELDGHSSGSSGGQSRDAVQDLTVPLDNSAQKSTAHEIVSSGMKEVTGYSSLEGEQLEMPSSPALIELVEKREDSHPTEGYVTSSTVMLRERDVSKRSLAAVGAQDAQGVILGWKMVFHEESNQYYYWNVTTGETSWEIPDILAQETDSACGRKDSAVTESVEMAVDGEKPNHYAGELLADDKAGGILVQNGLYGSFPLIEEQNHAASSYKSNAVTTETEDDALGEKYLQSDLLKNYEQLFEKLTSFRSKCNLHGHDQMLKCLWELETRLTDIKSLASCGYSFLPYWEYCKGRFLCLEAAVDDVLRCSKCKELNEVHVTHETGGSSSDDMLENFSQKNEVSVLGDISLSESAGELKVATDCAQVQTDGATACEHVPSHEKSTPCYEDFSKEKNESNRIAEHSESTSTNVLHSEEDVDMDVDMEVEDIAPSSNSIIEVPSVAGHVPLDQLNQSNLTAMYEPSAQVHRFSIPPAPDDDWIPPPPPDSEPIPPPPPDSEPIPPPPPDEHPESIPSQSSGLATTQSYSYPEQFSYSTPHFEVYDQADTVAPNSSLFANGESYQPTISHPPLYYEALAVSYSPATFAVNPVQPSVYIGVQDDAFPPALEASGFHNNSIYNISNAIDAHCVGSAASLINSVVSTSSITSEVTGTLVEIPHSEAPIQEPVTTVATGGTEAVHVPSVPPVATSVAASTTVIKGQSKVLRAKKRTISAVSSLRSNKKVSSLVDKWKAAKEELKEEEKEPKTAYEILEMKRQREIEEWRAQQIASGEAKDNANFQPLGGDWRERVKRRRAQLAKESGETSTDGEGKQPPDLDDLSKGLPPGWQVYWDDSSKQAYYGNSVTSETTWIRPTK